MAFLGIDSEVLGFGTDGGGWLDMFFVDVNQASSLLRITMTPAIDEEPIF